MEKDEMTTAQLLRIFKTRNEIAPCGVCKGAFGEDSKCTDHQCCDAWVALADKVEVEIAKERRRAAFTTPAPLSEIVARYTKIPAMEGEGIVNYLERCYLPRPRCEGGAPLQFGGRTADHPSAIDKIQFCADGTVCITDALDNSISYKAGTRIGLPAAEELGADGVPIREGDTVWDTADGFQRVTVVGFTDDGFVDVEYDDHCFCTVDPGRLTHKEPDSLEKIDADAKKDMSAYWNCFGVGCRRCPALIDGKTPDMHYGVSNCHKAKALDLLRRQRELDERTMRGDTE